MITNSKYSRFTSKEIKPRGWLKRQLRIQAESLSGNLDKMWPDIRDSKWIGGDKDGWERVPYWLDGFIPLAYLLEDEDLIKRAQKYVEAIIAGQQPDGWICPCSDGSHMWYDMWAMFLLCKVLVVYYECTGDDRIEEVIYKVLKQYSVHSRNVTLFFWGHARWFECLIAVDWLYRRRPEKWIEELAVTLSAYGYNYKSLIKNFQDTEKQEFWSYRTHIVNLAMAYKSEALMSGITGEDPDAFAQEMYETLMKYHGSAVGYIAGDECLAGKSPIQATELCSIVEAMFSFEKLFEITGNTQWADRLEIHAYNALPATISEDMWTHQYLQQVNQIACTKQEAPVCYTTCAPDSNCFGLEPNFGCCTANFNQGWPKFALSTFYYRDSEIISAVLAPSQLTCIINDSNVKITVDTDYPFKSIVKYTVECEKPTVFDLGVRIPSFAKSAVVDGEKACPGEIYKLHRTWEGTSSFVVNMEFEVKLNESVNDMVCLQRGPLYYSVPIKEKKIMHEYEKNGVERKFPYCDYEFLPESDWNYAFTSEEFTVEENDVPEHPFSRSQPPVTIETVMAKIDWGLLPGQTGVCNEQPAGREKLSEEKVKLQPYGCTNLRMTVMPKV